MSPSSLGQQGTSEPVTSLTELLGFDGHVNHHVSLQIQSLLFHVFYVELLLLGNNQYFFPNFMAVNT